MLLDESSSEGEHDDFWSSGSEDEQVFIKRVQQIKMQVGAGKAVRKSEKVASVKTEQFKRG